MKKHYSLQRFLSRRLLLLALLMTVVPAVAVYLDARHEVDELFDASLVQTSKVLNGILTRKAVEANPQHIADSLLAKDIGLIMNDKHHPYEKKLSFQIWDSNGLVVQSKSAPKAALAALTEGFHSVEADGHQWLSFALYSEFDDWWVVVAERADFRGELVHHITMSHVFPIVICIPLLLLLVSWTLKRGFTPLKQLGQDVGQRELTNLARIDNQQAPHEVQALIDALNDLLQRLQASYERERVFVGEVAHELRTPLAGMLLLTENLIDELQDPQAVKSLITSKHAIKRLTHLVNQLLVTSRSSIALSNDCIGRINIKALCGQLINEQIDRAEAKNQRLTFELEDCYVQGHEGNLASLIGNVIDNAIRYTPEQGDIHIQLQKHRDQQATLIVADSGVGIPLELQEKAKDRFYRLGRQHSDGSGLGLAIVKNVTEQMQWQWQMGQSELGGLAHQFRFTCG